MIIFPPMLTFAAIGFVTVAGIFDEVKNSLHKIQNSETVKYIQLVNKIASQVNVDDMEYTKNLIQINWNEYAKRQKKSQETPYKFVCPFSDDQEFVLINQ